MPISPQCPTSIILPFLKISSNIGGGEKQLSFLFVAIDISGYMHAYFLLYDSRQKMVAVEGFEPTRYFYRQILNLLRLPITPYRQKMVRVEEFESPLSLENQILSLVRLPITPYPQKMVQTRGFEPP